MTTYTRTADGKAFTATEDGRTFTRSLDDIMGLDALPVRVNVDGTVTDDIREHRAPEELYGDDDAIRATVKAAGWELLEGYTGQYGYNGPALHASEFIGGGLEEAILKTPGIYAVEVVYADDESGESEPAGWVVMRKLEEPHIPALGNSTCAYRLDGLDTDGTPFYLCLTHGEREISNDAPCAVGIDETAPAPLAPLLPGDRVEVDGRERMVTSVISGHHRGRHSLHVAHVAPGDDPWNADVTTIPLPLSSWTEPISPRVISAHVLTSAAHTLRVAGVIIPETPPAARREYVAARERGETVTDALSRARLEMVADAVLSPTDDFSGWDVNAPGLLRVTLRPELDALCGTAHDADGQRLLFPIVVPDGITLTVSTERDDDSNYSYRSDSDDTEDFVKAWQRDEWEFRTVVVTARATDGTELSTATLGGVEIGRYWPGTEAAQLWHTVPALICEALDTLPDDALPMTCGTCGHRYADNTPAGRCPREADHPETVDLSDLLTVRAFWDDEDMCPVVQVDTVDGAGHVRVNLNDAPIYDADPGLTTVCLSCGHRYADDTPAGRCPREAFHVFDNVEDDDGGELPAPTFTIVVHIDLSLDDTPWSARLMADGEIVAAGIGSTPAEAVECLAEDAENYDDEAAREFLGTTER